MSAPELNVGWRQIFQALMISLMIVVIDERLDLLFKVAKQEVILQLYPVLQHLVPAFDLALCLQMVRCTVNVVYPVVAEPVSKVARDVT